MRKITVVHPLLFVEKPAGNDLIGLPHYLVPMLGKADPDGNPLLTYLGSIDPRAFPHVEVEITLRVYERGDASA